MESTKTVQVQGNTYTIKFPNVGQFIDIRVLEQRLSKGTLRELLGGVNDDLDAYAYIATYANIAILIPELMKDLKVNNLLDLQINDFSELADVYLKEIQPWINDFKKEMKANLNGSGKE